MREVATYAKVKFEGIKFTGEEVVRSQKRLFQLRGVFEDNKAFENLDQNQVVYEVDTWCPVLNGTEGGLFFGLTHLYPGLVNDEYFMTFGHFHSIETGLSITGELKEKVCCY